MPSVNEKLKNNRHFVYSNVCNARIHGKNPSVDFVGSVDFVVFQTTFNLTKQFNKKPERLQIFFFNYIFVFQSIHFVHNNNKCLTKDKLINKV